MEKASLYLVVKKENNVFYPFYLVTKNDNLNDPFFEIIVPTGDVYIDIDPSSDKEVVLATSKERLEGERKYRFLLTNRMNALRNLFSKNVINKL